MTDLSHDLFHSGELEAQERSGARDLVARVAPRMVRDHLTMQHRLFFQELPFVIVGTRKKGQLWADLLAGPPGFARASDDTHLEIWSPDVARLDLKTGDDIGILGLQPETRRRNRENGHVQQSDEANLLVKIEQSYGNCPKYITRRIAAFDVKRALKGPAPSTSPAPFNEEMARLIARSDTFFIATGHGSSQERKSLGVDVSHRGGAPGFVRVEDDTGRLSIPDYSGNNMFNTVGNLALDPKCGLLFVDFETGKLLQLSGEMRVEWDPLSGEAPRLLHFTPLSARWVENMHLSWSDAV